MKKPHTPTTKAGKARAATTPRLLARVGSLAHLTSLANSNPRYAHLALVAAANLGGAVPSGCGSATDIAAVRRAIAWLRTNAQETTERGVVDEINFVRDCVDYTLPEMF